MIEFLASLNLSVHLDVLAFESADDVLRVFPSSWAEGDNEPRDAIMGALFETWAKRQSDLAAFAASANPAYASGSEADMHAQSYGVARVEGESDTSLVDRAIKPEAGISPAAIMGEVKKIIAPFTSKAPWYSELPDDGVFLFSDDGTLSASNLRGCYLGDVPRPVVNDARRYDVRPYSRPGAWFLWGSRTSVKPKVAANNWGKAIIGIPAIFPTDNAPLDTDAIAGTGGERMPPVFAQATLEVGTANSVTIRSSSRDATTVLRRIRAVLDERLAFPCQATIYLDPVM